jgi:hypothetical protein
MDPQDRLHALLDGVTCTVCEDPVPSDRVRLLAWRDDLAFLQIDCAGCRSTSLGFVMTGASAAVDTLQDSAPPISSDDVLDMHAFLSDWNGDFGSVLNSRLAGAPRELAGHGHRTTRRGVDPRQ